MREKSIYLSDLFMEKVWPAYERTLKLKKTRNTYFTAVCNICDFAKTDFLDLTVPQISAYFSYREGSEHTPTAKTMHSWLSTYRVIGRFIEHDLKKEPLLESYCSPFEGMYLDAGYTDDIKVKDLPSEAELEKLLDTARHMADDQLYLILLFATKCAMTSGEILSLTPKKIQVDAAGRGFVAFRDKKRIHERIVKIPGFIMQYLYEHRDKYGYRERLFLNKNGDPLSERSLQKHMRKLMEEAGLQRAYTVQDIRNLSIAKMLYYGASEEETAEYVGIQQKWIYRYSRVIPELNLAPCDRM